MKGIFFSEFLAFLESNYGIAMVDSIIEKSNLTSGGIYTAVGTYDFQEMLQLLEHLVEASKVPAEKLLFNYGCYFFSVLETRYHHLLGCYTSPIELLAAVDHHIHVEVRKLYPDAALPKFSTIEHSAKHLVLQYESSRALYQFGLGLIHKTFTHFNTSAHISTKKINTDGTLVLFTIHLLHVTKKTIEVLERALAQEKKAKQQAEKILAQSASELYALNKKLLHTNKRLEALVEQKSSELKGIFENIADAYAMINLKGRVLKMNDIALSLLDFHNKDEIKTLLDLVVPEEKEKESCYFRGAAGYIVKPLKYEDYVKTIARILNYWSINEIVH